MPSGMLPEGGGGAKSPPAILAFLQNWGQGQKTTYFCDFGCGTHFCAGHGAKKFFCCAPDPCVVVWKCVRGKGESG